MKQTESSNTGTKILSIIDTASVHDIISSICGIILDSFKHNFLLHMYLKEYVRTMKNTYNKTTPILSTLKNVSNVCAYMFIKEII